MSFGDDTLDPSNREGHADHGRGSAEGGPDDVSCPCREDAAACARAGCGFCAVFSKKPGALIEKMALLEDVASHFERIGKRNAKDGDRNALSETACAYAAAVVRDFPNVLAEADPDPCPSPEDEARWAREGINGRGLAAQVAAVREGRLTSEGHLMQEGDPQSAMNLAEAILFGIPQDPDVAPGPSLLTRGDAAKNLEFIVEGLRDRLTVAELVRRAHETSKDKGWYEKEDAILSVLRKVSGDPSYSKDDRKAAKQALADGVSKLPERLALLHSELSEALEEHRAGRKPDEIYFVCASKRDVDICPRERLASQTACPHCGSLTKPEGIPVEIADVVIRCADFAGRYGIDLEAALRLKLATNEGRAHRHGGKVC